MANLDEILAGKDESFEGQPRDDQGRFASSAPPAEPTPIAETAPTPVPEPATAPPPAIAEPPPVADQGQMAALLDERRKRQQSERERDEARAQLETYQRPAPPPQPETDDLPDMFADPQGFAAAIERRAERRAVATAEANALNRRANQSEEDARERWTDYEDKRQVFATRLQSDPVLRAELNRHVYSGGDLGKFVYKTANTLQQLQQVQEVGSIDALVERRVNERLAQLKPAAPVIPQSLNAESSPSTTTQSWSGPPPLGELLKRK